jgi:hypothetical protein
LYKSPNVAEPGELVIQVGLISFFLTISLVLILQRIHFCKNLLGNLKNKIAKLTMSAAKRPKHQPVD